MRSLVIASVICSVFTLSTTQADAQQIWQVRGGTVSVSFFSSMLKDLGIEVNNIKSTGIPFPEMETPVGFKVERSNLNFRTRNGGFETWLQGGMHASGGFSLGNSPNGRIENFEVTYRHAGVTGGLVVRSKGRNIFDLSHAGTRFDSHKNQAISYGADVTLTREFARAIGKPHLEGQLVAVMTIEMDIEMISGNKFEPPQTTNEPDSTIDCILFAMSSLSSLGRTGTFPNGWNGLSMSTTSCNRGTANIPWRAPMNEEHPVISMNVYRLLNGRVEQIGVSWLKHGFLSTNSNGCGTCQQPGSNQLLGVNCSDTYGTGNNGDRYWLGPRSEVNPFTGRWTCRGSHFANYVDDCVRRYNGNEPDPTTNRIRVRDEDLNVPGATFVYEAYYILENDIDVYNNVGWRPATANWNAGAVRWDFTTTGAMTVGPYINSWGDNRAFGLPRTQGDAILAVKVTDNQNGTWTYDYALYLHNLDRQVREVSIALQPGLNVTNVEFRDVDFDPSNDWAHEVLSNRIRWHTDTYAQNPNANSVKYSTIWNFRFTCNAAPVTSAGTLGLFKPGTLDTLAVIGISGPPNSQTTFPSDYNVYRGQFIQGGMGNLYFDDNSYLTVESRYPFLVSDPHIGVEVTGTSPVQNPNSFTFTFEGRVTSSNILQRIWLFNYSSNSWELVDERNASTTEQSYNITPSGNLSRFVQNGTKTTRARVGFFDQNAPIPGWRGLFDRLVWTIQ